MPSRISFRQGSPDELVGNLNRGEPGFNLRDLVVEVGLGGPVSPSRILMEDPAVTQYLVDKAFRDSPEGTQIISFAMSPTGPAVSLSFPDTDTRLTGVSPSADAGTSSTYLRGDGQWASIAGGGDVVYQGDEPSVGGNQVAFFAVAADGNIITHSPSGGADPVRVDHIVKNTNSGSPGIRTIPFYTDGFFRSLSTSPDNISPSMLVFSTISPSTYSPGSPQVIAGPVQITPSIGNISQIIGNLGNVLLGWNDVAAAGGNYVIFSASSPTTMQLTGAGPGDEWFRIKGRGLGGVELGQESREVAITLDQWATTDATQPVYIAARSPSFSPYAIPSELTKTVSIMSPTLLSPIDLTLFFTSKDISLTQVRAVLRGASTPTSTLEILTDTDRSAAGTTVVSSVGVTNTTTGQDLTLAAPNIPIDSFVWLETTGTGGTVHELSLTFKYFENNI